MKLSPREYNKRINAIKQQTHIHQLPIGAEFFLDDIPYIIEPNPQPLSDCEENCALGTSKDLCCNANRPICCAEDRDDNTDVVFTQLIQTED